MNELLPRRDAVLSLLASRARPLSVREIAARLLVSEHAMPGFQRLLDGLAQEGSLWCSEDGRFSLEAPRVSRLLGASRPGSLEYEGLLEIRLGAEARVRSPLHPEELRIPTRSVAGALHGDRVRARVLKRGPLGPEGEVVQVLQRAPHRIAGTLRRRGSSAWIEPDDERLRDRLVVRGDPLGAEGDAVVGLISRFPAYPEEHPEATVLTTLGPSGSVLVEEQKLLVREGFPLLFSATTALAPPPDHADLTHLPLSALAVHPDGPLDLAFHVTREGTGFRLWLFSPDLATLVPQGSPLDLDARLRGAAVSFPAWQYPLFPPPFLEAAALLPGRPRPALGLSCLLDATGEPSQVRFLRARVQVALRVDLDEAAGAIDTGDLDAHPGLVAAATLVDILHTRERVRGRIALAGEQARVRLKGGRPVAVERAGETEGERRVLGLERALERLGAELAGAHLASLGLAAPFRTRQAPAPERLRAFLERCERAGIPGAQQEQVRLSALVAQFDGHPWGAALGAELERLLPEERYELSPGHHESEALGALVSFTRPMRRYADLLGQRVLTRAIEGSEGGLAPQGAEEEAALLDASTHALGRERAAALLEREALALHRAMVAEGRVGSALEGVVFDIDPEGLWVRGEEPLVEVRVKAEGLGRERYTLDEKTLRFLAAKGQDGVGVGDRVRVVVEEVSVKRRQVCGWRAVADGSARGPLRHGLFRKEGNRQETGHKRRR
jgi:ribonuclease R